jgi:NAD(P)-dependent dehydrogenase (short-subunit alcohol dehydrogenase family)
VTEIQALTGHSNVESMVADLSSQEDTRRLAQRYGDRHSQLHVLVNNAGAFFRQPRLSVDGIEMTFALNHLGHFMLSNLLLDLLIGSAPSRVVNVSSGAHVMGSGDFSLDRLQRLSGFPAYSQSKLANVMFTYELARRLDGRGVTANAVHPGFVATNLWAWEGIWGDLLQRITELIALSPEEGAQTSVYAAASPEVEGVTGKYFAKKRAVPSSPVSYDRQAARQLWELSAALTDLPEAADLGVAQAVSDGGKQVN